ncbi:MAG: oligosaccharide flippase family protein [Bacteroidia bacterium]|nr:oligosaccharide flippase family protein [Bacteroidia bacterium]
MKLSQILNSKQIRTAAVGSLAIKFLSALFALINGILMANMLSVKGFGVYVLAFTTITIVSVPVSLGLPFLITRYVSKYEIANNLAAIKGLLIRSNQLVVITSLAAVLLAFVAYLIWWNIYPSETVATFWYSFILLPLLVFGSLRAAALRGMKLVILGQMPDTFLRNFFLTIPLATIFFLGEELTPSIAMLYHCAAAALAFAVGYYFLYKKLLGRLVKIKAIFFNRVWMRDALPFSVTSGVQIIKSKVITYVLAIFGSVEAVAIFDVALRGASLVSFTMDAMNSAISPYISSAFEQDQRITLERIVKRTARIVFVFSIPVALVLVIGGEYVLALVFGEEYVSSYVPLVILCVGQVINALVGPIAAVLNMTGNQSYLSRNQIQMMVTSILLSIPLIHILNVTGAALVYSAVIILQNLLLLYYIRKKLKLNTTIF